MIFENYKLPLDSETRLVALRSALYQYKNYLRMFRIHPKPPPPFFEKTFLAGSDEQQKIFIARFELHNELFASCIQPGKSMPDDKMFIWSLFKKLDLRPPSNLMDKIEIEDYIEIRDKNGVQIFGNFEFLTLLSYSVEEVFWYSWEDLFARDEIVTQKIVAAFVKSVSSASGPFDPEVPEHVGFEKSAEKRKYSVKMKMFSPVFSKSHQPDYMLATSKIQILI